jgi:hypothetical protein
VLALGVAVVGCSSVKKVVVKDIPLEEQKSVLEEYKDRYVWTRVVLQDLGEGGSLPRDVKVKIVDVGMVYGGTVTVATLQKKNRIVQGLEIKEPLTREKIDAALAEFFWFEDPTLRHVAYIRKYGKKIASAIMDHDMFVGMPAEAALQSWGTPARKVANEINGVMNEQWIYPTGAPSKNRYVYLSDGKVIKWDE